MIKELKKNFNNIKRIMKITLSVDKKYPIITISNMILNSIISPISLLIMQMILNSVQKDISKFNNIVVFVFAYICIEIFISAKDNLVEVYLNKFNYKLNLSLNTIILDKVSELSIKDYENSKIYDKLQRAEERGIGVAQVYLDLYLKLIQNILTIIFYILILIKFNVFIIIVAMVVPVLEFLANKKYNNIDYLTKIERTNDERKAWYKKYMLTKEEYYKEIKLNNLFTYFKNEYIDYNEKFINKDVYNFNKYKKKITILDFIGNIVDGTIFLYIIFCGYLKKILIGDIITYVRALTESKSIAQMILQYMSAIKRANLDVDLLFSFLDMKSNIDNKDKKIIGEIEKIEIKNLSYKYKLSKNYVLKNINLIFSKDKINIILGKNGSGKTTLLKIILGFYDDYEGDVLINGINLREINKESYMKEIGCLFQDFSKYEASYYENIVYGNIDEKDDFVSVENIAEVFGINELISQKKDNIHSQIGYWFDDGTQISAGQWQKIAMARTFFKNASLYVMDEPNSALDVISEKNLDKSYISLLKDKISIIVIHRFKYFINENVNIILLNNGEIDSIGSHEKLLDKSKLYRELYEKL